MDIEHYLQEQVKEWQNPLLLKDGVGKPKPTIYDIPNEITFGRGAPPDEEGAREIVNTWKPHEPSTAEKDLSVDYLKWNRFMASTKQTRHVNVDKLRSLLAKAEAGECAPNNKNDKALPADYSGAGGIARKPEDMENTVSSIDIDRDDFARRAAKLNKLRADKRKLLSIGQQEKRDIYHNVVKYDKSWMSTMERNSMPGGRSKSESALDPQDPSFAHGRRKDERPPTPMDMVMGMEYARMGARENKHRFQQYQYEKKEANKFRSSEPTKASRGHAMGAERIRCQAELANEKPQFVLSRFKNVKGRLAAYIMQPPVPTKPESRSVQYI